MLQPRRPRLSDDGPHPAAMPATAFVAVAFVAAVGHQMLVPPRDIAHLAAGVVQLAGLLVLLARHIGQSNQPP